jgi:glycine dehydrogenase subunit 1
VSKSLNIDKGRLVKDCEWGAMMGAGMRYESHTEDDRRHMLDVVGVSTVEELFAPIPLSLRRVGLQLPPGLAEPEVRARMEALAGADRPMGPASFLGAGCYRHFVPAAVRALTARSEFATAYTPYQAEVSQGTLQHIFEFQTCICELTGLDVANASLYDGPSALAEAAFMALRLTRREEILVSAGVHPEAAQVVGTYAAGPGLTLHQSPLDPRSGATDIHSGLFQPARPATPRALPTNSIGAVLVQQPNCLGVIEDLEALAEAAHALGALLVVAVNPATLGILEAPGRTGADIAAGDVQVFGCAPSFGGPSAGFLACRKTHVRQIPGRLVGQTIDEDGRTCYTLTLQAREQHIRRAKATSNICSNQALSALAATIHLALLGPEGLRQLGLICLERAHYLHAGLCALAGVKSLVEGPFFHEFALELPCSASGFVTAMRDRGVDPGVPFSRLLRGLDLSARPSGGSTGPFLAGGGPLDAAAAEKVLLVAVTELNTPEELDRYLAGAGEVLDVLAAAPTALAPTASAPTKSAC